MVNLLCAVFYHAQEMLSRENPRNSGASIYSEESSEESLEESPFEESSEESSVFSSSS